MQTRLYFVAHCTLESFVLFPLFCHHANSFIMCNSFRLIQTDALTHFRFQFIHKIHNRISNSLLSQKVVLIFNASVRTEKSKGSVPVTTFRLVSTSSRLNLEMPFDQ